MKKMRITQRDFIRIFLLLSVVPTGLWVHLDLVRFGALPLLLSFFVLEFAPASWWNDELTNCEALPKLSIANIAIGLIALAPITLYLALTWKQEAPIGGDFSYQFSVSRAFMLFFLRQGAAKLGLALLALVGVVFGLKWIGHIPRFAFLGLILLLYAVSYKLSFAVDMLGRYPDFYYFLATPLNILSSWMQWDSPMNANRLTTYFSFVLWLWVLRPLFIRRWPDLHVLPFALFYVWHKQVLWFGTTTYLESWSAIFVVLAFESLVALPSHRKWLSLVWIGFSAITKEPPVVLIALFTLMLLLIDWWKSTDKKVDFYKVLSIGGVAFFSGTGFLCFYIYKKVVGGVRVYTVRPLEQFLLPGTWQELALQLHFQFGTPGVILTLLVVTLGIYLCIKANRKNTYSGYILFSLFSFLFMIGFFLIDAASEWFTGYSRYHLFAITALASVVFPITYELISQDRKKLLYGLIFCCFVFNSLSVAPLIASSQKPDDVMNDMEYFGMPCYFPIRRLLERYLEEVKPATPPEVGLMAFRCELSPAIDEYPNLMKRIRPRIDRGVIQSPECKCSDENKVQFAGFQNAGQVALLGSVSVTANVYTEHQKMVPGSARECVRQLRETCKKVLIEPSANGEFWGALGYN